MKGNFYILLLPIALLSSCDVIDERIYPVVGVYRAHVLGVAGPFDLIVSTDRGDNILIEAPFDGFEWFIVRADIDNQDKSVMEIDIPAQDVGGGIRISGDGFYHDGTVELSYTVDYGGGKERFKLIGTRL